ncbi:MAG: hypothetical protein Alpg2KO_01640 [Alphaproteobacteria bacterium]
MAIWYQGGDDRSRDGDAESKHGNRPWDRTWRAARTGHIWASDHGKTFYAKLAAGLTIGVLLGATGGAAGAWAGLTVLKAPIAAKVGGVVCGAWIGRTIGVVTAGVASVGPKKAKEGAGVVMRGFKTRKGDCLREVAGVEPKAEAESPATPLKSPSA